MIFSNQKITFNFQKAHTNVQFVLCTIYCIQYKILQTLVRQVTKAWKAVGRGVKLQKRVNKETSQIFG